MSEHVADHEFEPEELEVEAEDPEESEEELDPETAARRAAALAHVRKFGDPVLRTRSRPVDRFDDALRDEVRRMGQLMIDSIGVGLAANQVGVLHRLLVYRVHQQSPVAALVNPEIEWSATSQRRLRRAASACRRCTSTSSVRCTSASMRSTNTESRW